MVAVQLHKEMAFPPLKFDMKPMSDADFWKFCQNNPDFRIERNKNKQLIIIPPTSSETGNFNSEFNSEPTFWNRKLKTGYGFDSSTGFTLPNGAIRSPDFSWIEKSRYENIPPSERRGFAKICPDFVVEICSPSDIKRVVEAKMEEYMECGARLGWLVDPQERVTKIYRQGSTAVETVPFEQTLSGEDVLVGFTTRLADLR